MNKHSILYKYKIIHDLIDTTSTVNSNILGLNFDDIYNKHLIQKIMQLGEGEFLNDKNFNTLITENKVRTQNFKISRDKGFESISIFTRDAASSIKSIALSGRNLSVIYL